MKKYLSILAFAFPVAVMAVGAQAQSLTVTIYEATNDGRGAALGDVAIAETPYGLVFTPNLHGLMPGNHGFHLHVNASCEPSTTDGKVTPAGAAGGHLDPEKTGRHSTPWDDNGHLGDLPPLYVDQDGKATVPVLAPKLKNLGLARGHALMVHAGHDNFADEPQPLGGGGARFACGVIE